MKRLLSYSGSLLICATLLMSPMLSSCSTGTDTGDTNVESGTAKDKDNHATPGEKQQESAHDNEPGADR